LCALIAREAKHSEVQGCAAKGMSAGETAYVVTQRQPGLEELPSAIARNRPRIYGHERPQCLEFIFAHSNRNCVFYTPLAREAGQRERVAGVFCFDAEVFRNELAPVSSRLYSQSAFL
tara:strand:- start:5592 stop:5945 length:354 start_codon:yes stop_codon:yes gene_type:complete